LSGIRSLFTETRILKQELDVLCFEGDHRILLLTETQSIFRRLFGIVGGIYKILVIYSAIARGTTNHVARNLRWETHVLHDAAAFLLSQCIKYKHLKKVNKYKTHKIS
jgi:hypothetical protein